MQQSTTPSLSQTIWPRWASRHFLSLPIVQTLLLVTFRYSQSSETVVMTQLRRWKRLWRRSLTRSHKKTSMGPSSSCWNGTTSALQPEEITSKGTLVSYVYYQWNCPYEKSLETYRMPLVCCLERSYSNQYGEEVCVSQIFWVENIYWLQKSHFELLLFLDLFRWARTFSIDRKCGFM